MHARTRTLICSRGQQLDPFPFQELAVALENLCGFFAYAYVNMYSECNAGKILSAISIDNWLGEM